MKLMYLTIDLLAGFFYLFILVKLVGKTVINQITPFTFISAAVLGELLGNALYNHEVGVFYILYAMTVTWSSYG